MNLSDLEFRVRDMDKKCGVQGCERPYRYGGYCNSHYLRNLRHGDPLGSAKRLTFRERFEGKVVKGDPGECWSWLGSHNKLTGYAIFNVPTGAPGVYKPNPAHRNAYELYVGPIPDKFVIDHLCRNRACVNPAHLEAVTQQVNILRGEAPAARAVRENRCQRGHEFTPENTFWRHRDGKAKRECRECIRARDRARVRPYRRRIAAS